MRDTFSFHNASVLSVKFNPREAWIVSSDTQKNLILSSRDGQVLSGDRTNNPFTGTIISIDWNPVHPRILIIGTMDERHALMEVQEVEGVFKIGTLQMWHAHKKYIIRTKWHPSGEQFVTASHDGSIIFYQFNAEKKRAEQVKQVFLSGCVEAAEYTIDGKFVIISVRDNTCLHYINTTTWEVSLANTNLLGDGHVSFNTLEIKRSPDGKHILASTDHSRAILFKEGTAIQVRNFYGLENDGFSQPRSVFDSQGLIYLTSQNNQIYVFDTTSGQLVNQFGGHSGQVRDMDYHPTEDIIATCSYDKTIKIWERKKSTNL
uniref:Anaphase-promoting complex subunit 4 WD40 domain-containing protein n=1 Tax=Arcella intermedia TaxID=1963864 RepID=A0A6B2L7E4_9EUKA